MKPTSRLFRTGLLNGVALLVLGATSLLSLADSIDAVVQTTGDVSYVSGGVGTESLEKLEAMASDFNIKLVFALKSGDYLSGAHVVIADSKGQTRLDTTAEGPWFMARLPAGHYRVVASIAGKPQTRQIAVNAARLSSINFHWDSE